jgi:hypothetical protein
MSNPSDPWNNAGNPSDPYSLQPQTPKSSQSKNPFASPPLLAQPSMIQQRPVPARLLPLAIVSVVLGVLALPMFLCAPISGLLAVGAIITGHLASGSIRRSMGTLTGKPAVIIGLTLGYVMLAASVFSVVYFFGRIGQEMAKNKDRPAVQLPAEEIALKAAERAIATDSQGIGLGNTETARRLAGEFARKMEEIDKQVFTDTKANFKLSGGHYVTWCEMHEGRCAFVVHVPEYRKFTSDAKKSLAKIAWMVAHSVARTELEPDDELGVGLHGVISYGTVMVGNVTEGDADEGVKRETHDRGGNLLLPFFLPEVVEAAVPVPEEGTPKQDQADPKPVEKSRPND